MRVSYIFLRNRSQEEDVTIAWNVEYSRLLSKRRTPTCREDGVCWWGRSHTIRVDYCQILQVTNWEAQEERDLLYFEMF